MKSSSLITVACGLLFATSAAAQRPRSESKAVPPDLRPPAGMCRIWLDGVPAARQPAPTDCASALRNRPARAQVIFGDDYVRPDSQARGVDAGGNDLHLKGVAPLPKASEPKPQDTARGARKADDRKKPDSHKPASTKVRPDTVPAIPDGAPSRG